MEPSAEGSLHLAHEHSAFALLPQTSDYSTDCKNFAPGALMEHTLQLGLYVEGTLTTKQKTVTCDPSKGSSTMQFEHYLKPVGLVSSSFAKILFAFVEIPVLY